MKHSLQEQTEQILAYIESRFQPGKRAVRPEWADPILYRRLCLSTARTRANKTAYPSDSVSIQVRLSKEEYAEFDRLRQLAGCAREEFAKLSLFQGAKFRANNGQG